MLIYFKWFLLSFLIPTLICCLVALPFILFEVILEYYYKIKFLLKSRGVGVMGETSPTPSPQNTPNTSLKTN